MKCSACNFENDNTSKTCERCKRELTNPVYVERAKKHYDANRWQKLIVILYLFFVSVFSIFKMPMNDYLGRFEDNVGYVKLIKSNGFCPIWMYNPKTIGGLEINYQLYFTYIGISLMVFGFIFAITSLFKKKENEIIS